MENKEFTDYYAFGVEGYRIGLCSCLKCGAAIVLSNDAFDTAKAHIAFHKSITSLKEKGLL